MSESKRERMKERIQKLLALSESSHEAEALLALERAEKLMIQYAISESELPKYTTNRGNPEIFRFDLPGDPVGFAEKLALLTAIAEAHSCKTVYYGKRSVRRQVAVIGFEDDAKLSWAIFSSMSVFMMNEFQKELAPLKKKMKMLGTYSSASVGAARAGFYLGFTSKVKERLKEAFKTANEETSGKYEIVLVEKSKVVDEFLDGMNVKENKSKSTTIDRGMYEKGLQKGDLADIGSKKLGNDKKELVS